MKKLFPALFLLLHFNLSAQVFLKGRVTDLQSGKPLPGALVNLKGTQLGTAADQSGNFSLRVPPGKYESIFTYLGYQTSILNLTLNSDTTLQVQLQEAGILTGEVTVSATRAGSQSMAVSTLNKEEISRLNTGQDVPYLLQLLPSVVVTSDAGTGIGYTSIRIRGTDQSRINVTINGIPLNDAESQQVYWVDLPDFASSTENIQVTRGAGSSTNGAGAFGGTINLLSSSGQEETYGEITTGAGSFNTLRNTVTFSTGRLKNNCSFDGRLSKITSDGYIDRGSSDLRSFYLGGNYADEKNLIRLNVFSGKEITYQSWYGTPESVYKNDRQGMQDYIDRNYLDEEEAANLLNSGRTYNFYTYDNQVDDYQQDHYQLHLARKLNKSTSVNAALHYTKGRGFYEEYKKDEDLDAYSISPAIVKDDTVFSSDLIRRKWLDNDFYGITFGLTSVISETTEISAGGAVNRYDGDHYGEVTWARYASDSEIRHRYYFNNAVKDDRTVWAKVNYKPGRFSLFGDLQVRNVTYDFEGLDPDGEGVPSSENLFFINPKAGILYTNTKGAEWYASVSVANKEPNRDDYTESTEKSRPGAESLIDYEAGFRFKQNRLRLELNGYFMSYKDQLVLTGQVNDVGNYTRVNTPESYRTGIETQVAYAISKQLAFDMNFTVSDNRIKEFTEYTDVYDIDFNLIGQSAVLYKKTPIAFSPAITAMGRLSWMLKDKLNIQLVGRYVGEQFLDNTGNRNRRLDDYLISDVRLEYKFKIRGLREARINISANNLFSTDYAPNGYTWGYIYSNQRITENFVYPQALIHYMAQLTLRF